jgi:hypothetical protein
MGNFLFEPTCCIPREALWNKKNKESKKLKISHLGTFNFFRAPKDPASFSLPPFSAVVTINMPSYQRLVKVI